MTTRSEREKAQKLNEQHQAILSKMLREEDNKYCADCEAKVVGRDASQGLNLFCVEFACSPCACVGSLPVLHPTIQKHADQDLDGHHGTSGCSCVSAVPASTATWASTSPESNLSTWTSGHLSRSRVWWTWATPGPDSCMKPTYQRASDGRKQTKQWRSSSGTSTRGKSTLIRKPWLQLQSHLKLLLPPPHRPPRLTGADRRKSSGDPRVWWDLKQKNCQGAPPNSLHHHYKEREKKKEEKKKERDVDKGERLNNTKQSECRASPKRSTEPAVDLLGLDAPEGGGKSSAGAAPISDELDIFGPMVSNPLPLANNTQQAQSSSSPAPPQADPSTSSSASSSTSTTTTTKAEEKKLLSKDSILSLYASSSVGSQPQSQQQPAPGQAGMYMGQPQMQFTPQGFTPGMGGAIPPTNMMGGGAMMSGMALSNGGYMGMQQQGVMTANQGQNMYNMQQGQQPGQWNMSQMTQQMSGMAMSGGGPTPGTFNQSGAPAAGWPAAPPNSSGQTLSTQLWK
ncbi:stromal membrane-associated protein 1-like isoform X3 [Trachinotus anak]|uniref:stromal membrane-associated protein 1-like isoform X3 n=1 Tax=Trachinotus anak TaxID=443729 RepID=UPI0039F24683